MTTPADSSISPLLRPETREALRRLELYARRTVDGLLHGIHRSRRKGISAEFDHHKNYQPGDPIRHVDWKVSARLDRLYVKRYLEDTALAVRLAVDASGSMGQRTGERSLYDQAARLAAALAYLAVRQGDSAGLSLADGERVQWLPAASTQSHFVQILERLAMARPGGQDRLAVALNALAARNEPRGLVAVFSDLMFDPDAIRRPMNRLRAAGHEVLIFQVLDRDTERFPFNRWVIFEPRESSGRRYRLDALSLRRLYVEEYRVWRAEWQEWTRRRDIHLVEVQAEEAVETALGLYLARRSGAEA